MTTNYISTFIGVSPDTTARAGTTPTKPETVAGLQHVLLTAKPYGLTSDDLLFEVHASRNGIPDPERDRARGAFFAKPQACLRASPLVKQFGWGLHHDAAGRVAAIGMETEAYRSLAAQPGVKFVVGIRSKRG